MSKDVKGRPPTFVKKPSIRQEDDGARLVFECKIKSEPEPIVTWEHAGVIVKETDRIKVSNRDRSRSRNRDHSHKH